MTDQLTRVALTPLERLQLRESLQDHWREQVQRITELSVALHTLLDARDETTDGRDDVGSVAVAISETRLRLAEIEQAMRRLDERSYGRCFACLIPISVQLLMDVPQSRYCTQCQPATARSSLAASTGVG